MELRWNLTKTFRWSTVFQLSCEMSEINSTPLFRDNILHFALMSIDSLFGVCYDRSSYDVMVLDLCLHYPVPEGLFLYHRSLYFPLRNNFSPRLVSEHIRYILFLKRKSPVTATNCVWAIVLPPLFRRAVYFLLGFAKSFWHGLLLLLLSLFFHLNLNAF